MPLQRQARVLAQAVRDQVEVARPRACALRLGPLDPVLEAVRISHSRLARQPQSEQVLGRLDEDGHLVAVVLAAVMQPVHGGADGPAEDRASLDELEGRHRVSFH